MKTLHTTTIIGINVSCSHQKEGNYLLNFPPNEYFVNALTHFCTRYADAQFVVVSHDPDWCLQQSFFTSGHVHVVKERHSPAVDMAVLVGCDHLAAFLGADAKGVTWSTTIQNSK